MRIAEVTMVLALALGGMMQARPVLAQSNTAPSLGAAGSVTDPDACRAQLDARHLTFSFTPPVAEGDCGIPLPVKLQSLAIGGNQIAFSAEPILDCRLAERL